MIEQKAGDERLYFCCKGCQGVYNLIHDQGLERFYERSATVPLTPQSRHLEESSRFDAPAFMAQFAKSKGELLEIALVVEGIHCAACVWLNEKVLHETDGVVEATINFSTNKAKILWDPTQIKLSKIIDTIRAIGYDAYAYDPKVSENKNSTVRKEYFARLIVAVFASMNIMWIALAHYAGYFTGMDASIKTILNVAEWILATPVLFYSGWVFYRGAYYGARNGFVNMDTLVATGATLTYAYSIYATLTQHGEAYFDSVSMIITFVLFGKFLEVLSKKAASDTLDKMNRHIPMEVNKVASDGTITAIPLHSVEVDDVLEVRAGERFALDGVVIEGETYVDESSLTGESVPVWKQKGDSVISGTNALNGSVRMAVRSTFENSTFAKLVRMLEESLDKKPAIERLANRLSGRFSSTILFLAIMTFIVWIAPWGVDATFERTLMVAISVIVIACPCALALATPVATLVGVSLGAKKGVLFKEAAHIETLAKATTLFVDKTGTLTYGKPMVVEQIDFAPIEESIVASMTAQSIHPISKAVNSYCESPTRGHERFVSHAGRGIEMIVAEHTYWGGSATFLREQGVAIPDEVYEGLHFWVARDKELCRLYRLEDTLREGAGEFVDAMKRAHIEVIMLTGDTLHNAQAVANAVGITTLHAHLSPDEKAALVKARRAISEGVVMVGDGVNDTIALASADIAISMGHGADVAVDTSDVVLLHDDLYALQEAFVVARRTYRLIKQNLLLSLLYNATTIPLAVSGYIIPLIAALSMSASSLLVVGNSLRIKWKG
ncbi:MAG: metal ABC transporter ATPase [Sulfurovum sp. PC08-66]|nr:MAG: metal ABC transporter ATPase [Sulfurovum sp. PC08-66]KIM12428.1 MAG: metal ABC transporter ATPase [Sulfuricurvum sp. PC08-66]